MYLLQPLTARDASANSIADALDLSQSPAAPVFPAETYPMQSSRDVHNRPILLAIYGAVVAFAVLGAAAALLFNPARRSADTTP